MKPATLLLLGALLVLVLLGARWGFGKVRLPAPLRLLVATGTVFIFIGALIGPQGANVFTADILEQLGPVLVIGLGWIGFLYGAHFEWRLLRRYPVPVYAAGLAESLLTLAAAAALGWLVLPHWLGEGLAWRERAGAALILGICASGTAPAGIFQLSAGRRLSQPDLDVLRFFSAVDDLPGIVLLGVMQAFLHPAFQHGGADGLTLRAWHWLGMSLAMGLGLGLVTHWLLSQARDVRHTSLLLLGVVALGAGTAALLRLSPLFVTALAGVTFANLSHRKESAYGLLAEREHSLYAVFLLVAGVLFRFDWELLLLLVPAYVVVRGLGKVAGAFVGRQLFLARAGISPLIGTGLLFQGGMALALAVSFERTHGTEAVRQVTTTIVVAVVVNELLAPLILRRVLDRRRRR